MVAYQLVKNWPRLPFDTIPGSPTGLGVDSNQNIFVFHRAGRVWSAESGMPESFIPGKTVLLLNTVGEIINSWGGDFFVMPHGLTVDKDDNIWLTDVGLQQVFKFSPEGKLLMTLGEAGVHGKDATHFSMPTDVVVDNNGDFYVSDGYGNSRIIKFSPEGHYILEWGSRGERENEFNIPHAIELDDKGTVYVADRENKRIQLFSPEGHFINMWTDKQFDKVSSVVFEKTNKSFVAVDYISSPSDEVTGSSILFFDISGNFIGKSNEEQGLNCWYHNIQTDKHGNIFVTDLNNNRILKFMKCTGEEQ